MSKVVTVHFLTNGSAEELRDSIIDSLSASAGDDNRPAPWIPGAVLKDVVEAVVSTADECHIYLGDVTETDEPRSYIYKGIE